MRLSEKELKNKYFDGWNDKKGNIVDVLYGDKPHTIWNKKTCESMRKYDIAPIKRYIYSQMGDYDEYYTLIGGSYIKPNGIVLGCEFKIKYMGMTWDICLNECYGYHKLSIIYLPYGEGIIQGWCTKNDSISNILSPSGKYKNTEHEILKILSENNIKDYGYGVKTALERCRKLYLEDTTNYFDER